MQAIVIDDSRAMRGIIKRVLVQMGFNVVEAGDGAEGLAKLENAAVPDLAMVDWNMPNMNGLEFIKAIRAKAAFAAMRIVMVTTEVEMEQVTNALSAGANEYVMKPFTSDSLREKIELLGMSKAAA